MMAPRDWTKAELDRMAGAYYTDLHCNDCSTPWDEMHDWERHKHRRGVRALLAERERVVDAQMAAFRASRTRSVRTA